MNVSTETRRIEQLLTLAWQDGRHVSLHDPLFHAAVRVAAQIVVAAKAGDEVTLRRMGFGGDPDERVSLTLPNFDESVELMRKQGLLPIPSTFESEWEGRNDV